MFGLNRKTSNSRRAAKNRERFTRGKKNCRAIIRKINRKRGIIMNAGEGIAGEKIKNERLEILARLENWLETPMLVLGFVWLGHFIDE